MSVPAYSSLPLTSAARIDFSWIKQAWTLFSSQSAVWVGSLLLSFIVCVGVWILLAIPGGDLAEFRQAFTSGLKHPSSNLPPAPTAGVYLHFAERQVRDILLTGTNEILIGGLACMALRQTCGEATSVFGVFCGVGMLATYPVFVISIAVGYLALTPPAANNAPNFGPAPMGVWPPPPRVPEGK